MVTSAPRLVVPDTLKEVALLIAPPIEEAPVIAKEKPPPATVDEVVTVEPASVVLAVNVTAPVYVCVEDVVMFAPILEVLEISKVVPLEIAAVVDNVVAETAAWNVVACEIVNASIRVPPIIPVNVVPPLFCTVKCPVLTAVPLIVPLTVIAAGVPAEAIIIVPSVVDVPIVIAVAATLFLKVPV